MFAELRTCATVSLDIKWLRDESLKNVDNFPARRR
jgi:hypothetical protein